eukprot:12715943-Alexandrium_andersonii.AAC.1
MKDEHLAFSLRRRLSLLIYLEGASCCHVAASRASGPGGRRPTRFHACTCPAGPGRLRHRTAV